MEAALMKLVMKKENSRSTETQEICGRLLGFIDEKECQAILNTEGAARKIFTSASVQLKDCTGTMMGNRIVFATYTSTPMSIGASERRRDNEFHRKIFISQVIKTLSYVEGQPIVFKCDGGISYTIQEWVKK